LREFFHEILEEGKKKLVDNIVSGNIKIEEEFILISASKKRVKLLYDQVNAIGVTDFCLQYYFTEDGYTQMNQLILTIEDTKAWTCYRCDEKLEETSIGCDYCNEWWHLKCAKLKGPPKTLKWFCIDCKYKK
jgi:hypothetical protein